MKFTIIGNGASRAPIPLDKLKGTLVGSNHIYHYFKPDYLTIVDYDMVKEVLESDYDGPVYYRYLSLKRQNLKAKYSWYSPPYMQYNCSGIAAIHLAADKGATEIDLLGFDCIRGRVPGYGPHRSNGKIKDPSFNLWREVLNNISKIEYDYIKFRRVVDEKCYPIPNIPTISVEDYIKSLDI